MGFATKVFALRCINKLGACWWKRDMVTFSYRLRTSVKSQFLFPQPVSSFKCRYIVESNQNCDEQKLDSATQALIRLKYLRLIKFAVRENGPILEKNPKLAMVVESARVNNVPSDFIDFAMNICIDTRAKTGIQELMLGNGLHFVVQYEDIDTPPTRYHLLRIGDKIDATVTYWDSKWHHDFDQKGIVSLSSKDMDQEKLSDILAKCGAESLRKEPDEEGIDYWKFYCSPALLHQVKRSLQDVGSIEEAYIGYVPKNVITPSQNQKKLASDIITELGKIMQVERISVNVELS